MPAYTPRPLSAFLPALVLLTGGILCVPAQAGLLLDLNSAGTEESCFACGSTGTTYGYQLLLSEAVSIDGLGVWDQGSDGLGVDTSVGLFDATGSLLASATIDAAAIPQTSSLSDGQWLMASIAPLLLAPGEYSIGQVFFEGLPVAQANPGIQSAPFLTVIGGVSSPDFDAGLTHPSLDLFGQLFAGPTLSGRAVPEPAVLALVLTALGALAAFGKPRSPTEAGRP